MKICNGGRKYSKLDELWVAVDAAAKEVTQEEILNLTASVDRRLECVCSCCRARLEIMSESAMNPLFMWRDLQRISAHHIHSVVRYPKIVLLAVKREHSMEHKQRAFKT